MKLAILDEFATSLILAYNSGSIEILLAHSKTLKSLLETFISISAMFAFSRFVLSALTLFNTFGSLSAILS
jgi:hypothetical protein